MPESTVVKAKPEVTPVNSHLHFMGIGGVSMSGLARFYHANGYTVSGCDRSESETVLQLRQEGIAVEIGHSKEHSTDIDTLVSTSAVSYDDPEIAEALKLGKRSIRRIELLAELFEMRQSIGISGTHGKSSTTGMVGHIFMKLGQDDTILVGAQLPIIEGNAHIGHGKRLIAEVDESDPGMAKLKSSIAVLTNLEADHIAGEHDERRTYHASYDDLKAIVHEFAFASEQLIYCSDWSELSDLVAEHSNSFSYGKLDDADYSIQKIELHASGSSYQLQTMSGSYTVKLKVPGEHNVMNSCAAIASSVCAGLDIQDAINAIGSFTGVGRRWQRHGSSHGALVIDDYAHHPTEVEATLQTAQNTGRRVRAVLQPHRHVRTAQLWQELADSMVLADEILVLDIYASGEAPIEGVSSALIIDRLEKHGKDVKHHTTDSAIDYLKQSLESNVNNNDLVITLGAGDVWKVASGLVEALGGDDGRA